MRKKNVGILTIIFFVIFILTVSLMVIFNIREGKRLDNYCQEKYGIGFKHLNEPTLQSDIYSCYKIIDGEIKKYYFNFEEIK